MTKQNNTVTIGSLIDRMSALREERRDIAKRDVELKAEYENCQNQLIELMDADGTVKATSKTATASIAETVQFNTVDWDKFMAYVAKHKLFYLVQRRVAAPSVRELYATKSAVPGLEPFVKREINLRNL